MVPSLPSSRRGAAAVALAAGVVHAAGVAWVVATLAYPIDTLGTVYGGTPGAVAGLVLLAGLPAYLLVRHRLVVPAAGGLTWLGWILWRAVATPRPEFSTRAGYTIVEGTRYVDPYVNGWYVWLGVLLLVGLVEAVVRTDRSWLPSPAAGEDLAWWIRREWSTALRAGGVVAAAHVATILGLAAESGYFAPNGFLPSPWYLGLATLAWILLGLTLLGAIPAAALVRYRVVAPAVGLAYLVARGGWRQQLALPHDPLPIYLVGWFFFLALLLALGGLELFCRVVGDRFGPAPAAE